MTDEQQPRTVKAPALARKITVALLATLGALLLFSMLAILLNLVLMQFFDSVRQWQQWRMDHYVHLLAWRLTLYGVLVVFWLKLKARLPRPTAETRRHRLMRGEILAISLMLLVELNKAAVQWGGAA